MTVAYRLFFSESPEKVELRLNEFKMIYNYG